MRGVLIVSLRRCRTDDPPDAHQPWFGSSEHINVGYSSSDAQVIDGQIKKAREFGISGFVVDWYGNDRKDFDHNYALVQASAAGRDFTSPALQIETKPTEGFEPSTPALRERCSGQLSYVGVRDECSPA